MMVLGDHFPVLAHNYAAVRIKGLHKINDNGDSWDEVMMTENIQMLLEILLGKVFLSSAVSKP